MDGIINVYKEKGYTSHDVVAKMRGILRMKEKLDILVPWIQRRRGYFPSVWEREPDFVIC